MNIRNIFSRFILLVFVYSFACAAQDKGYWYAEKGAANSITGDIKFYDELIKINAAVFPLARIRALGPDEVNAAFDVDVNSGGTGVLYRVNIPASQRFLNRNTLCGAEDTQWMATHVFGRKLQVAFFSGANPPKFTLDALQNSSNLCGTFAYSR